MFNASAWSVLWASLISAIATGLGALPFLLVKEFPRKWLGVFNGIAAGLMMGASFALLDEGISINLARVMAGMLLGMVFVSLGHRYLDAHKDLRIAGFSGADGMKSLLIVGVMTLHSFSEGVGIGVSFGGGDTLGNFITTAIAIHNIPEGLAISLILVPRGTSPLRAGFWGIFSSLPQPLMAVPAFLLVTVFEPFLPVGLGLAGGAMLWMAFAELIPETLEDVSPNIAGITVTISLAAMLAFQTFI